MPAQVGRPPIGGYEAERKCHGSSDSCFGMPENLVGWLEQQPVLIWSKAPSCQDSTSSPQSAGPAVRSRGKRSDTARPSSSPGSTSSSTVPSGQNRGQRPASSCGPASSSASLQGLAVYCTSMELSVNKKLHRQTSSRDRCSSASTAARSSRMSRSSSEHQHVECLPAWAGPGSSSKDESSSSSSSGGGTTTQAADAEQPGISSSSLVRSGHDRAVDLTVSLRERVHQLEKRNRALEKKAKSLKEEKSQREQHSKAASREAHQPPQQQQQHAVQQQSPSQRLQVCVLHTADIIPSPSSASTAVASVTPAPDAAPAMIAAASQGSKSDVQHHQQVVIDIMADCWCPQKEQQHKQQQQQEEECVSLGHLAAARPVEVLQAPQPPRAPEPTTWMSSSSRSCSPLASDDHEAVNTKAAALQQQQQQQQQQQCQQMAQQQEQQQGYLCREQQYQQTIAALQRQVSHMHMLHGLLANDYSDLEFVLKATDKQRREYAARYAFVVLDHDSDGYISVEQVEGYELFACYAPVVLHAAFRFWRWQSGFPGYLNIEDFVRFVEYAEDRSSREAQRFWFSVLDADGDGHLGWQDMRSLYDAVDKSGAAYVVTFEDLMNQVRDMVGCQAQPERGFTCGELGSSKLGAGVIGLLTNHNNMLLQRSTAEWGRGEYPL